MGFCVLRRFTFPLAFGSSVPQCPAFLFSCPPPASHARGYVEDMKKWRDQSFDCVEFKPQPPQNLRPLLVLEPYPLYATHRLELSRSDLHEIAARPRGMGQSGSGSAFGVVDG